ncbi:MAG: hypothetical protein HW391_2132 [Chloroflexi bacterium]|nr:hypothetical protein [Chloroflexota bacterium]
MTPAPPIPAATVVLLRPARDGFEVLLTRRPATMEFGPNICVFPGGRVDPADSAPAALDAVGVTETAAAAALGLGLAPDGGLTPALALAHHVAAVREAAEETGIALDAQDLIALSRWVTPISVARRFDVRFFAALVPPETEVGPAGSAEVAEAVWMAPSDALAAAAAARIELWQPTMVTLQQLDGLLDEQAVRAAFGPGVDRGGARFERGSPDLARLEVPWAAGIPGRRASGWLLGRREVVVVDPADPTGVTTDAVLAELQSTGARLAGVVVTGFMPERHAGVEMFAHGLGLPVAGPADAGVWVPYPVIRIGPGDRLPFGDAAVTLAEVRGLG